MAATTVCIERYRFMLRRLRMPDPQDAPRRTKRQKCLSKLLTIPTMTTDMWNEIRNDPELTQKLQSLERYRLCLSQVEVRIVAPIADFLISRYSRHDRFIRIDGCWHQIIRLGHIDLTGTHPPGSRHLLLRWSFSERSEAYVFGGISVPQFRIGEVQQALFLSFMGVAQPTQLRRKQTATTATIGQ